MHVGEWEWRNKCTCSKVNWFVSSCWHFMDSISNTCEIYLKCCFLFFSLCIFLNHPSISAYFLSFSCVVVSFGCLSSLGHRSLSVTCLFVGNFWKSTIQSVLLARKLFHQIQIKSKWLCNFPSLIDNRWRAVNKISMGKLLFIRLNSTIATVKWVSECGM